jgi:hypothetical protein
MIKKAAIVVLLVVAAVVLLIAPVALCSFALARPPLAASAAAYERNAACAGPAQAGLPQPTHPIPDSMRDSQPCAVTGAIVAEKDTLSGGTLGATHYVLGLRSDLGDDFVVTLDGDNAANLWNAIQSGDRVLIQTMLGHVTLVGDGTRTVRTDSNPATAAQTNAVGLEIAGTMCVLEIFAGGIFVALRRRGPVSAEDAQRDI